MAKLTIKLKRARDGSAALTCVRSDDSVTWQRQLGSIGTVFPPHDITHFAVETALGYQRGFYGLIADGWDISDFGSPWPRGPIPAEARVVERLVSLFEMEDRVGPKWWTDERFEEGGDSWTERDGAAIPTLSDETLERVRALRRETLAKWAATPPGQTLELTFTR